VSTYDEALTILFDNVHDICLLDFRLGARDGLEILEETKLHFLQTPVIFLTGQGEYDVDIKAMQAGAADYLVKEMLSASSIERSIRYALDRAKSRQALQKAYDEMELRVRQRTAELAAVNKELRNASEKIKLFAYSVSHDLKSPAVSLYGLAKRLHAHYGDLLDEKGSAYCTHIMNAAEHIASLVEKINIFVYTKESPLKIQEVDLHEVISLVRDEFSDHLTLHKIEWHQPGRSQVLKADRLSLVRVLRNLVDNALKYGGDDLSSISIGLRETEQHYIITVTDDGIGIGERDTEDIFRLFSRGEPHTEIDGAGMGLAIVKEIAERHRGHVWVEGGLEKGFRISVSTSKSLS
jgi:light-regulated signal transduction histidine kinase (bacteriophytochrome)